MIQVELKIDGRVQGVGFRHFTKIKAREIGLLGWVKNTADGGVFVVVQGNNSDIETLIDFLKIGPPLSKVENLTRTKVDILSDFNKFSVKF